MIREQLKPADFDVIDRLIPLSTVILNRQRVLFVNGRFKEVFGFDHQELNRIGPQTLVHQGFEKGFFQLIDDALAGRSYNEQGEICLKARAQSHFWVEYKVRLVSYEGEDYLLVHLLDINEKKKTQNHLSKLVQLRESMLEVTQHIVRGEGLNQLYGVILKSVIRAIGHACMGTVMLRDGDYVKSVAQIGFDEESLRNFKLPIKELFLYKAVGKDLNRIAKVDDLKVFGDYLKIDTVSGKDTYIRSTISPPIYINHQFFGAINVDSTEIGAFDDDDIKLMSFIKSNVEIAISNQLLFEEKAFLSRYDHLTSLYNRHYFEEIFEHIVERAARYNEKFNLVVFDLNDLKRTNDDYGHIAGDALLKYFSESCRNLIRKSDILARYGGDEFVGIFYNCSQEKLRRRIDGHLKSLHDTPLHHKGRDIVCSYSYGISEFGSDGMDLGELFKIADDRMYQNKIRYKLGFDFIEAYESGKAPNFSSLDLTKLD